MAQGSMTGNSAYRCTLVSDIDMKRCRSILLILCLPLVGIGCSENSPGDSGFAGPCVIIFEDEVLHIDEASGSATSAIIGQLELSSFVVNGQVRTSEEVVAQRQSNVVLDGELLRCTLPCSFGTEPGRWEFTALAPGYLPTGQSATVEYGTSGGPVGGCPAFLNDGTHISAVLDEAVG